MKLPAIEPFSQCQACKAEMLPIAVTEIGIWWCSECGTMATERDQWVPKEKTKSRVETTLLARLEAADKRLASELEIQEGPK